MIGIYKITCLTNNRVYIGQSTNVLKRLINYKNITNCRSQTRLFRSLNKYGVGNHFFEVICECELDQLNDIERYWQEFYDVCGKHGLNCMLTKASDRSGYSTQAGTKRKPRSEETKLKLRLANLGKKASDEVRAKMSATRTGKTHKWKEKMKPEHKAKLLARLRTCKTTKGYKHSDETKARVHEANKHKYRMVFNTQNGIYYDSVKEAADALGKYNHSHVLLMLKGKYPNKTNFILA